MHMFLTIHTLSTRRAVAARMSTQSCIVRAIVTRLPACLLRCYPILCLGDPAGALRFLTYPQRTEISLTVLYHSLLFSSAALRQVRTPIHNDGSFASRHCHVVSLAKSAPAAGICVCSCVVHQCLILRRIGEPDWLLQEV